MRCIKTIKAKTQGLDHLKATGTSFQHKLQKLSFNPILQPRFLLWFGMARFGLTWYDIVVLYVSFVWLKIYGCEFFKKLALVVGSLR